MKKITIVIMFLCLFGLANLTFAKNDNATSNLNKVDIVNSSTTSDKDLDEKIKDAVSEKASSSEGLKNKVEQLEKRSKIKTFLIGTDYKTVGALRSEMVQTRNEIDKINRLVSDLATSTEKDNLLSQLKTLEEAQAKVEQLVTTNENKFSLFGWFVKLFIPTNE